MKVKMPLKLVKVRVELRSYCRVVYLDTSGSSIYGSRTEQQEKNASKSNQLTN